MPYPSALGSCSLFLALLLLGVRPTAPPVPLQPPQDAVPGHLVLVVEGTVENLAITHAVAKPDAWGGVPKGLRSPFTLQVLDDHGRELLLLPVDLSRFDTDRARIGKPLRVDGCEVRDWRIGVLLNVPWLPAASRYVFRRDDVGIGETSAATVARLLAGERR